MNTCAGRDKGNRVCGGENTVDATPRAPRGAELATIQYGVEDALDKSGLRKRLAAVEANMMHQQADTLRRLDRLEASMKAFLQTAHTADTPRGYSTQLDPVAEAESPTNMVIKSQQRMVVTDVQTQIWPDIERILGDMKVQIGDDVLARLKTSLESTNDGNLHRSSNDVTASSLGVQADMKQLLDQLRDYPRKMDEVQAHMEQTYTVQIQTEVGKLTRASEDLAARVGFLEGDHAHPKTLLTATGLEVCPQTPDKLTGDLDKLTGDLPEQQKFVQPDKRQDLEADATPAEVVDLTLREGEHVTYADVESHCSSEATYSLQESVWDSVLFIGLPCVGTAGSCVVGLALFANMFVQIVFTVIVYTQFIGDGAEPLGYTGDPDTDTGPYMRWRWKDGHSFQKMDGATDQGLASRVCGGDQTLSEAAAQTRELADIRAYTEGLFADTQLESINVPSGTILCTMCIFMFCVSVLAEIDSSTSFLFAVWDRRIRKQENGGKHSKLGLSPTDTPGFFKFFHLTNSRSFLVSVVLVIRLTIAVMLLGTGSLWLCYNTGIEDILLNAAALKYILDVDELIFGAFCPSKVKVVMEQTEPLKSHKGCSVSGIGLRIMSHLAISALLVIGFLTIKILPITEHMRQVEAAMCDGALDFVIGEQSATGQLFVKKSNLYDESDEEAINKKTFAMRATKKILDDSGNKGAEIAESVLYSNHIATYEPEKSFQSLIDIGMSSYVEQSRHRCRDKNLTNDYARLEALRSRTKNRDGKRCADFKSFCSDFRITMTRLLCPVTCRCGMPRVSLYADGPGLGCAREACREDREGVAALGVIPCRDPSVEEFKQMPAWKDWWDQYVDYWGEPPQRSPFYSEMRINATKYGCNFTDIAYACEQTESLSSVRSFCPGQCGCDKKGMDGCPSSCKANQTQEVLNELRLAN